MTTTYAILSSLVGKESQHFRRRTWPTFAALHRSEPGWFQELVSLEILRHWAKNAIVHLISDRGPHSVAALHERVAALDVPFLNTFLTRLAEAGFLRFVSR